jgi:hypothetical protein
MRSKLQQNKTNKYKIKLKSKIKNNSNQKKMKAKEQSTLETSVLLNHYYLKPIPVVNQLDKNKELHQYTSYIALATNSLSQEITIPKSIVVQIHIAQIYYLQRQVVSIIIHDKEKVKTYMVPPTQQLKLTIKNNDEFKIIFQSAQPTMTVIQYNIKLQQEPPLEHQVKHVHLDFNDDDLKSNFSDNEEEEEEEEDQEDTEQCEEEEEEEQEEYSEDDQKLLNQAPQQQQQPPIIQQQQQIQQGELLTQISIPKKLISQLQYEKLPIYHNKNILAYSKIENKLIIIDSYNNQQNKIPEKYDVYHISDLQSLKKNIPKKIPKIQQPINQENYSNIKLVLSRKN